MKTIKEKILYIKFAKSLGMPVDAALEEEVTNYLTLQKEAAEVSDIVTICAITDTAGGDLGAIIGWNKLL